MQHERLVHNAVPNKEHSDAEIIEQSTGSKNTETKSTLVSNIDLNNEVSSTVMNTDVMSIDKELSTMTVNVSSVTGISFISPPEKKTNSAPYIEILTRLHNNSVQSKKRQATRSIQNSSKLISKTNKEEKNNSLSKFQKLQRFSKDSLELNNSNAAIIPTLKKDHLVQLKTNCINENLIEISDLNKEVPHKNTTPVSILPKTFQKVIIPNSTYNQKNVDRQPENVNSISTSADKSKIISDVDNSTKEIQNLLKTIVERKLGSNKKKPSEIIVIPSESNVVENVLSSDCGQRLERENYTEFLDEGKKLLAELKAFLEKEKTAKRIERIRKSKNIARPLSKSNLYARIVPFLTPKTARIVHKELFPSMRHMHIS